MLTDALRASIDGTVLAPADDGWDAARRYHAGIGEPEAYVRPRTDADVAAAVLAAADAGAQVHVRGGGHSAWGSVPGSVVLDLADLAEIQVGEVEEGVAVVTVGGGATWGDVARELGKHGLGISSGDTASVGVGGLTLGGGIGWMVRAWGLAADQLVGVSIVGADGVIRDADATHLPELFWGVRGGHGSLGVVTRFRFAAHVLPAVVFGEYTVTEPRVVLRGIRDALPDAPRDLTVTYMDVPAMDPSAPPGATVTVCWAGDDVDAARAAVEPLTAGGLREVSLRSTPYAEILAEMPAVDPDQLLPGFVGGNALVAHLDDALIDALTEFREARPASVLFLRSLGGAYADPADDATAFGARAATWFVMAGVFDMGLDEDERERIRGEWAAIERRGLGVYGNFVDSTSPDTVERMYSPPTLERLRALKRQYDPHGMFVRTHSVHP